jgi:hypothetical protein
MGGAGHMKDYASHLNGLVKEIRKEIKVNYKDMPEKDIWMVEIK